MPLTKARHGENSCEKHFADKSSKILSNIISIFLFGFASLRLLCAYLEMYSNAVFLLCKMGNENFISKIYLSYFVFYSLENCCISAVICTEALLYVCVSVRSREKKNYSLDYSLITLLHRMPIFILHFEFYIVHSVCIVFHILFGWNFCCSAHVSCINMTNAKVEYGKTLWTKRKKERKKTHTEPNSLHSLCMLWKVNVCLKKLHRNGNNNIELV